MEHIPQHASPRSVWPLLLGVGLSLLIIGIISSFIVSVVGVVVMFFSIGGWTIENRENPHDMADMAESEEKEAQHE